MSTKKGLKWNLFGDRLTGTAVVTGASSGLGECFARRLAKQGVDLILVARRKDRLEALAQELERNTGIRAEVCVADLSDPKDLRATEEKIRSCNNLALLINSAGFCKMGAFKDLDIDVVEQHLLVNNIAPTRLSHAALNSFSKRGAIINVTSIGAIMATPYGGSYCATKAFLGTLSTCLSREYAGSGIRIQNLRVGLTRTDFPEKAGMRTMDLPNFAWLEPENVITSSLRALSMDQSLCIPSIANRIVPQVMRWMPDRLAQHLGRRAASGN